MNILFCGDEGIKRGVLVSILSLIEHNTKSLEIYIATISYENVKPFKKETADFLDSLVKRRSPKSFVRLIDATKVFVDNLPKKNMGSYFTPCSMLRLYMDKMPELEKLSRILYLDYDVVCRGDISDFYNMSLDGIEAAGVLDIYGKHFYRYHGWFKSKKDKQEVGLLPREEISRSFLKQDYMNSGVMLFNLEECRKTKMFEKTVKLCGEKWMMLADQAALNKSISKRKLMPRKYNEQGERPREDTVLHHFSNNFKFFPYFRVQRVKPFEVEKIHKVLKITEYDDILKKYSELEKCL